MASNPFIYLYTSDYGVYYRDVLNILALPKNMKYRFRYDYDYIPRTLKNEGDLERLKGCQGLVALKNVHDMSDICIPIRKILVSRVEPYEESFVHFEFQLLDYPQIDSKVIEEFTTFTKQIQNISESSWVNISELLFHVDKGASDSRNWHLLVEKISNYGKFKKCIFTKLHSVYDENEQKGTQIHDGCYMLKSGHNFTLQFIHSYAFREDDPEAHKQLEQQLTKSSIEAFLSYSAKSISPIQVERRIEGRYDLNKLFFYCPRTMRTESSVLLLEGKQEGEFFLPSLQIPLSIRANFTRDRIVFLFIGGFLFLGSLIDIFINWVPQSVLSAWNPWIVNLIQTIKTVGVLAPMLAIMGAVLVWVQSVPNE